MGDEKRETSVYRFRIPQREADAEPVVNVDLNVVLSIIPLFRPNMSRTLRKRDTHHDDSVLGDEEVYSADPERFRRLLESKRPGFVLPRMHELDGHEFNLEWVRRHGLAQPVRILHREGLGMRIPG